MTSSGKCTAWLPHKGFGFIEENGPEKRSVFCHQSNLKTVEGGFRALHPGQEVQFDVEMLNEKPNAVNVAEVGGSTLASATRQPYRGRGSDRGGGRGGDGFRGGDRGGFRGGDGGYGRGGGGDGGYGRGGGGGSYHGGDRGGGGFQPRGGGWGAPSGGGGFGGGGGGGFGGGREGFGQHQQQF